MVFFCVWPYVVPLIIFFPNAPNGCRDMTRQNWVVFSKVFGLYYRKLPRIDSDFDRVQIFLPRAGEMTRKLSRGNEGRIWGSKMAPKNPRNKTLRIWAPYALDPWDEVVCIPKLKNWQDLPLENFAKIEKLARSSPKYRHQINRPRIGFLKVSQVDIIHYKSSALVFFLLFLYVLWITKIHH